MTRSAPIVTGLLVLIMGCGGGDIAPEPGGTGKPARPGTKEAVDRGVKYLFKNRNRDGSYGKRPCVGITGLCVRAMAECHRKYREADGPQVSAAVEYMLANVQKDGGIYNPNQGL